ncbi:MAG: hypothetical protein Q8Q14_03655 [Gemmatimonadales bacterium]|nr:hypothetical protein [Gemmatimonadales bacterium]
MYDVSDLEPWFELVRSAARAGAEIFVRVENEVRELPPQPGDRWVRRELTGRQAVTVATRHRSEP